MLHIACPNTSIDVNIELNKFKIGEVQRALKSIKYISGKGVNSACTCDFLKEEAMLHAIVGELDYHHFNSYKYNHIKQILTQAPGETRRNITIVDCTGLVAHIQTTGYTTPGVSITCFFDGITNKIKRKDVVLLSGSLPTGLSNDSYLNFITDLKKMGITLIVDTDLHRLPADIKIPIDFIKPNLNELSDFAKQHNASSTSKTLSILRGYGIKNVIVTCGRKGSYLFNLPQSEVIYSQSSFNLDGKNDVGSGDAFIGAFASAIAKNINLQTALRSATAAGNSNIFYEGPGRIGQLYYDILDRVSTSYISFDDAVNDINKMIFTGY